MSDVKVRVADGFAVYDGTRHRNGGELVTVDSATADEWVRAGWVEPVKVPTRNR